MIRGTSAKFKFTLPCDFSELESAKIVFWQKGNSGPDESRPLPIIKLLAQCEQSINTNELYVHLSQEETLRFTEDEKAYVQLVVETTSGKHIASREEMITVYPIYDDAVLGDEILPTPDYDLDSLIVTVDDALSEISKNPVQNKVITTNFKQIQYTIETIYSQLDNNISPNLLPSVTHPDDNDKILKVINGVWTPAHMDIGSDVDIDETLSVSGSAADAKITGDRLNELSAQIADILYEPIEITSFKNSVETMEIGSTLDTVTLSWVINKDPTALSIEPYSNELSLSKSGQVELTELGITSRTTWSLTATDERNSTSKKSTTVNFYHGVYYGVVNSDTTIDNNVVLGLIRKLQGSKSITFTVTADNQQHLVYALPTSYGVPEFNVGGFDGGFHLFATINFTNSSGYMEPYSIYISDNHSLGKTTVKVS